MPQVRFRPIQNNDGTIHVEDTLINWSRGLEYMFGYIGKDNTVAVDIAQTVTVDTQLSDAVAAQNAQLSDLIVSNWTIRTSAADNGWISVCWSPERGLFVAVAYSGTGNRVMTSPDGITWTIRTSAADNDWMSVCWSPERGLFVAVAVSGTGNGVMTSLFLK